MRISSLPNSSLMMISETPTGLKDLRLSKSVIISISTIYWGKDGRMVMLRTTDLLDGPNTKPKSIICVPHKVACLKSTTVMQSMTSSWHGSSSERHIRPDVFPV